MPQQINWRLPDTFQNAYSSMTKVGYFYDIFEWIFLNNNHVWIGMSLQFVLQGVELIMSSRLFRLVGVTSVITLYNQHLLQAFSETIFT